MLQWIHQAFDRLFAEHAQLFFSIFGIQTGRSQENLMPENFQSIEGKMFVFDIRSWLCNYLTTTQTNRLLNATANGSTRKKESGKFFVAIFKKEIQELRGLVWDIIQNLTQCFIANFKNVWPLWLVLLVQYKFWQWANYSDQSLRTLLYVVMAIVIFAYDSNSNATFTQISFLMSNVIPSYNSIMMNVIQT